MENIFIKFLRIVIFLIVHLSVNVESFAFNSSFEEVNFGSSYGQHALFITQKDKSSSENKIERFSIHSLRLGKVSNGTFQESDHRGTFLDRGASLSMHLRQMANIELGVTTLQDTFNTLAYVTMKKEDEKEVTKMIQSLDDKLKIYSSLVEEMAGIVKSSYKKFREEKLKNNREISGKNLILDFAHGRDSSSEVKQQEYYPCCIIPDHYLVYDPHFGTQINAELWCDSGFEQEKFKKQKEAFFTPFKLTEGFVFGSLKNEKTSE